jgi:hypothetical protein
MYVQNRWVPVELMNTLLGSGLLMALVILGLLFWLSRGEKKDNPKMDNRPLAAPRKKHKTRKSK